MYFCFSYTIERTNVFIILKQTIGNYIYFYESIIRPQRRTILKPKCVLVTCTVLLCICMYIFVF